MTTECQADPSAEVDPGAAAAGGYLAAMLDRPPDRNLLRRLEAAQSAYIDAVIDDHGPSARGQAAAETLRLQHHGEQIAQLAQDLARDFAGAEALIEPTRVIDIAALAGLWVEALDAAGFTVDAQAVTQAAVDAAWPAPRSLPPIGAHTATRPGADLKAPG